MMNFAYKMMNSLLKMVRFAFKTMDLWYSQVVYDPFCCVSRRAWPEMWSTSVHAESCHTTSSF